MLDGLRQGLVSFDVSNGRRLRQTPCAAAYRYTRATAAATRAPSGSSEGLSGTNSTRPSRRASTLLATSARIIQTADRTPGSPHPASPRTGDRGAQTGVTGDPLGHGRQLKRAEVLVLSPWSNTPGSQQRGLRRHAHEQVADPRCCSGGM